MGASNSSGNGSTGPLSKGQCGGAKKRKRGSTKRKTVKRKTTTKKKAGKKGKKLIKHGNHSHRTMRTLHACEKKR